VTATAATGAAHRHVHEADVVRVLTFAAVIGVHTVAETNGNTSVAANGVVILLHFTREAFFCLTGFVLVHQYLNRPFALRRFWGRRFLLIGVPYVIWTVIYSALQWVQGPRTMSLTQWLDMLGRFLVSGTAWYHMYFLLVSMQIYLLYPLIAALIRRTAGNHGLLLAASAALQLALVTDLRYAPSGSWLHSLPGPANVLVIDYQLYILAGGVVAYHLDRCLAWLRAHRRHTFVTFVLAGIIAESWYLVAARRGEQASVAAAVWQPIMVPWSLAVVTALAALGSVWADRRRPGQLLDRAVTVGSDRSFGVYLVHPAVLWLLLWSGGHWLPHHVHGFWLAVMAYALTVGGALAVTEVFRRSSLSLALTGRPRLRHTPAQPHIPTIDQEMTNHAPDRPYPARARPEAPPDGVDHGDRQRPAHRPLRRRAVQLRQPY
jgi:peptidoglycan/LPS O-acetylase OafA/YrhL